MNKSENVAKPQTNSPAPAPLVDTSRAPVGGQMPPRPPLPTMADVPGYLGGPN